MSIHWIGMRSRGGRRRSHLFMEGIGSYVASSLLGVGGLFALLAPRQRTEQAGAESILIEGTIDLTLTDTHAVVRCQHGDASPESRGMPATGDVVQIRWDSAFRDTPVEGSIGRPIRFDRNWTRSELKYEQRGATWVAPGSMKWSSPLLGHTLRFGLSKSGADYNAESVDEPNDVPDDTLGSLSGLRLLVNALPHALDSTGSSTECDDLPRALWPVELYGMSYGKRGYSNEDWPSVHIALIPELPPTPSLWLSGNRAVLRLSSDKEPQEDGLESFQIEFAMGSTIDPKAIVEAAFTKLEGGSDYAEMMGFSGDGISWSWKGRGKLIRLGSNHTVRLLDLQGELTVRYKLEWSYDWDAPAIERFNGEMLQEWTGNMAIHWSSEQQR
jgi:hypothetical protein